MAEKAECAFIHLIRLIKHADLAAIQNALESGVDANLENKYGYNLLMVAAAKGSVAVGQLLISKGADVNRATPYGTTAVGLAVISGHIRFLKLLLEHGANPNCLLNDIIIDKWIPVCQFDPKKEAAIVTLLKEYRSRLSN